MNVDASDALVPTVEWCGRHTIATLALLICLLIVLLVGGLGAVGAVVGGLVMGLLR